MNAAVMDSGVKPERVCDGKYRLKADDSLRLFREYD
jgi:hypothetical protein